MAIKLHKELAIARQNYRDGRIAKAATECERVLAAEPRHHDALQLLGVVRLREGRIEEALALSQRAVALAPENAESHNTIGLIYSRLGRTDEALASFEQAITADPGLASAHYNRGNALKALARHEEAMASFDRALAINPRFAEAHNNRGTALATLGRHDEALAGLGRALALAPRYTEALFNRGNVLATLARHKEALACFEKVVALNPRHGQAHNSRGMALAALGRYEDALASLAQALALRPNYPDALLHRGIALAALKRNEEALASYDRALIARPLYAEASANRAAALVALFRPEEALADCAAALALRPNYAEALNTHGAALAALDRPEEALASFDAALGLAPRQLDALTNRGAAFAALNRHDLAIAAYEAALNLAPEHAVARWNRAHSRLVTGDLLNGWRDYEWRWAQPHFAARKRGFAQKLWQGEDDLAGKTILLHAEQGLGDTIQFCRYAPILARAGASVVLEARGSLAPLLASLDGVATIVSVGEKLSAFELHVPMMSLPLACRTTLATIPARVPYLSPPAAKIAAWRARLDPQRIKIGLAWSGSRTHANDRNRSMPLARLAPLIADERFEFHVLSKDVRDADRATMQGLRNLRDHSAALGDFADTAALAAEMQLVISVDTSIAHLAGALGLPVWVMLPFAPDWRWLLERDDSPWYPTARLFRQPAIGDWDAVIAQIARALEVFAARHPT